MSRYSFDVETIAYLYQNLRIVNHDEMARAAVQILPVDLLALEYCADKYWIFG